MSRHLIILALLILSFACGRKSEPEKPNILFILADDLGYHDLSCMGSNYYETPNIDRIGQEGMIFTKGHATCQVCSPSRASIMTGKFPARHGITEWIGARSGEDWRKIGRHTRLLPAEYRQGLPYEYITLPEALKEEGYRTFFAGKWHLGSEGSHPEDHGFDINIGGWRSGSPTGGFFSPYRNPKIIDGEDGENLSMRLARETADFIRDNWDTSFFAFLSFYAVHSPIQTTEERWAKYRRKAENSGIEETGFIMEQRLPIRMVQDNPVYAGLLESMDEAVGLVLDALDKEGLADNTIVVFTSDNGGVSSGDAYATSNLPLRGGKGYQWEGGILEPYLMRIPWLVSSGSCSDVPVTGTDFYPTLLELVGADPRPGEHVDGLSLLPLLEGGTLPDRPLYWHYPHYSNQGGDPTSILKKGNWKLIHYWEGGRDELYDLASDPYEEKDMSALHPDRTKQMSQQLLDWLGSVNAGIPQVDPQYDSVLEARRNQWIRDTLWTRLEKRRMEYLSVDWKPDETWWGSQPKRNN